MSAASLAAGATAAKNLAALRPQQIGKVAATRVTDRIEALFIDLVVLFQARE
jgi:hypothetical protein